MSWKTKLFGTRIEGKALVGLLTALGEDAEVELKGTFEGCEPRRVHGRYKITPQEKGLHVCLYVFKRDFNKGRLLDPSAQMSEMLREVAGVIPKRVTHQENKNYEGMISYK